MNSIFVRHLTTKDNPRILWDTTLSDDILGSYYREEMFDSPPQVKLSFGSDGQIQTDWVAVRVIFVGTERDNHRVDAWNAVHIQLDTCTWHIYRLVVLCSTKGRYLLLFPQFPLRPTIWKMYALTDQQSQNDKWSFVHSQHFASPIELNRILR